MHCRGYEPIGFPGASKEPQGSPFPKFTSLPSCLRALLTMVDSRPSSTDEKFTVVDEKKEHKSKGFFSRKKDTIDDEKYSIGDGNAVAEVKTAQDVPPIGFTDLFRLVLDFLR